MGSKVLMKWSAKITSTQVEQLIRAERDLSKAVAIFDAATGEYRNGFRHDHRTFGVIVSKLVSGNQIKLAEEMLHRMKEEHCQISEDIFLTLCRGYGRVHKPMEAVRVFESMKEFECEVSERCYVTLMSILVDENQSKMAMRFYRYMRKKGIQPSVVSLNILIKALCKNTGTVDAAINIFREMPKRGCPPDSYTYGTLISGLCKFGRTDEGNEFFKEMEVKGCKPTVVTYSSLIHGLCKSDKLVEALELFKEMASKGVKPNVFTYGALMDGLCKSGRSSQAMELLEVMVGERLSPNMITYSTLIHGLCKDGSIQEAMELFDRMKLQGLKPDAGLYGKIINSYCELSKFQEAANLLDEMALEGILPNRLTWSIHVRTHNSVVQSLCDTDLDRAYHLYLSMRTRGLNVEPMVFSSLIKGFCERGEFHKGSLIVDQMFCDGFTPDEEVWKFILSGLSYQSEVADLVRVILSPNSVELEKVNVDCVARVGASGDEIIHAP